MKQLLSIASVAIIVCIAEVAVSAQQTTYTIAIAEGLPDAVYKTLRPHLLTLYAETATPGDIIQLIQTPSHNLVGRLEVPNGNARQRLMLRSVQQDLARVLDFLDHPPTTGAHPGNLYLPTLVPILARESSGDSRALLVGNVQFKPMFTNDSEWDTDTGNGLVPAPDDLFFDASVCPFGTVNLPKLNAKVFWLVPRNDWARSAWQEERLPQFWSYYFQRLNSTLAIDISAERAFTDFSSKKDLPITQPPLPTATEPRLAMLAPPPPPQALSHSIDAPQAGVFASLPEVQAGHVLAAAAWNGNNQTDLDIWFRLANEEPSDEVNFTHMESPAGHLFRDIRQASPDGLANNWMSACECAEIYSDNLENIVLYIDVYAASQPVSGTLRVVWRGQSHDIAFSFPNITSGDHADQRATRDQSLFWKRVQLSSSMFH